MKSQIERVKKNRIETDKLHKEYESMRLIDDLSLFGRADIKVGSRLINNFGYAAKGKEVVVDKIHLDYVSTWTTGFRQTIYYTPINKDGSLSKNTHDVTLYLKLIE